MTALLLPPLPPGEGRGGGGGRRHAWPASCHSVHNAVFPALDGLPHPGPLPEGEGAAAGRFRVLAVLMLLATPAYAVSDPAEMLPNPAQEARAEQVGRQLRCLVCQNESIEDSNADLARDLRGKVRGRIAAGDSDEAATAWVVARYGDFVRLRPLVTATTAVLWASPVLAVLAGLSFALLSRRRAPAPAAPLTDAERRRLDTLTGP
jgi:cytochrome c-type biogenesis protein CcmH